MQEIFVNKKADPNDLRQRASQAFDAKFRAEMADACMACFLPIGKGFSCCCPEGAILVNRKRQNEIKETFISDRRPVPYIAKEKLGFEVDHHRSFQMAFDEGRDDGTPEAALGILYRVRYS